MTPQLERFDKMQSRILSSLCFSISGVQLDNFSLKISIATEPTQMKCIEKRLVSIDKENFHSTALRWRLFIFMLFYTRDLLCNKNAEKRKQRTGGGSRRSNQR